MTPGIVLKPGLAGRPGTRGWNRAGLKKKQGKKKLGVTRLTRSKTRLQPVDFCFFTKMTSFWFKKNWLGRPGQNPEPGPWTRSGLKTMTPGVVGMVSHGAHIDKAYTPIFIYIFLKLIGQMTCFLHHSLLKK